jgi:hypothetical protein
MPVFLTKCRSGDQFDKSMYGQEEKRIQGFGRKT